MEFFSLSFLAQHLQHLRQIVRDPKVVPELSKYWKKKKKEEKNSSSSSFGFVSKPITQPSFGPIPFILFFQLFEGEKFEIQRLSGCLELVGRNCLDDKWILGCFITHSLVVHFHLLCPQFVMVSHKNNRNCFLS